MKHTEYRRKMCAVWMACVMTAVMACAALPATVQASASETSSAADAGQGSITVDKPKDGVVYYGYKIFDVTYTTVGGVASYSYFIAGASPWYANVRAYANAGANGLILSKSGDGYAVSITESKFSAANFANHLKDNVGAITAAFKLGPVNTGETSLKVTGLELGYYFVLSKSGVAEGTEKTQALCSLTTTDPDATIVDKNDTPFQKEITAIDKETFTGTAPVINKDVQVGQTITYTIKGKVPDTSGAAAYIYRATDTMQKGLTFQKDVAVKIGGKSVTLSAVSDIDAASALNQIKYIDPVERTTGGGFELSLNLLAKSSNQFLYKTGDDITITYSALVNADAVNVISENKAEMKYGTDPDHLVESTPSVVRTLSSSILIDKYKKVADAKDTATKLPGAKFVLKRKTGDEAEYYKGIFAGEGSEENNDPANLTKVEWVKSADNMTDRMPTVPELSTVTVVTTDADGAAVFAGLANGTYYLIEVEAPAGYNPVLDPIEVVINAQVDSDTGALKEGEGYTGQTVKVQVANNDGSFLPSTGGIGTTLFYVCGVGLMLTAVILLAVRRHKDVEKTEESKKTDESKNTEV